jgi:hypothetical protein
MSGASQTAKRASRVDQRSDIRATKIRMRLLHCARNTWEKGRLAGCFPTKAHRTLWSDSFLFDMEPHSPRPATVHDVRDFYTVTKKTGQALQSATYVKLTRRKAPASAPIRPVYDLPATDAIYQRFVGIDGSAYFVGGLGMTTLTFNNIVVVPICSGVGLRLGANVGYLKFTPTATWNPF